jgi:hypothetical protein
MTMTRWIARIVSLCTLVIAVGCAERAQPYGRETHLQLPGSQRRVWAVAPVINLSGQAGVDPLLQADILFQQLQTVEGLTVIPVDRVGQVYAALHIEQVQTPDQAAAVIDLLGCDALVVATVTQYDPYNPPKFAGAIQLFQKPGNYNRPPPPDPRDLVRSGAPGPAESLPQAPDFVQAVGMYDSANGSVRDALLTYANGRHEPAGPMGAREYFANMDRYTGFAYYSLLEQLLVQLRNGR